ncbi:MAG: ATP synthase F1 subunit delta [Pirellulaceae bacterium]
MNATGQDMSGDNERGADADIGRQQIGAVYATAFLGAAAKSVGEQAGMEELDTLVREVLNRLPDFAATLASPRIPANVKVGLIDRALAGRASDCLLNFLKVLAGHGRLDCLRHIARAVRAQYNVAHGIVDVYVTTAEPINNQLAQRIAERLQQVLKRQVELHQRVDDTIIGGLVVRVGDTVYDASVANQLEALRKDTLDNAVQTMHDEAHRFAVL